MLSNLYFADRTLCFTDEEVAKEDFAVELGAGESVSRTKVLNFLENHNRVVVRTSDPERAEALFAREFLPVEAAGGVAVDAEGRWLLIHRNGRWDLPKGHVEPGESVAECAVRETAEETGVAGAEVERFLCRTRHAYCLYGRWELKTTHWFRMRVTGPGAEPAPQREEGIDRAAWLAPTEVEALKPGMFPTILRVLERMEE